jgi:hypothetical protein
MSIPTFFHKYVKKSRLFYGDMSLLTHNSQKILR